MKGDDMPTHVEECVIKLKLPARTPTLYRNIVHRLTNSEVTVYRDDTCDISYNLNMEYFGRTVRNLKRILQLVKAGYVTSADFAVLNHKISLIQRVILEIDRTQRKLKGG